MLRPRATRWFEILAARDDATLVLEALARTGAVELETSPSATDNRPRAEGSGAAAPITSAPMPTDRAALAPLLAQFLDLSARYRAYWPPIDQCPPSALPQAPVATLQRCLATLRAWAVDAEPLIQALQWGRAERDELLLWQAVLGHLEHSGLNPRLLSEAGPLVQVRLLRLPAGTDTEALWSTPQESVAVLVRQWVIEGAPHLLLAGPAAALQTLAQQASAFKGSLHEVPAWLQADAQANHSHLQQRLAEIDRSQHQVQAALTGLHHRHALPQALGDAHRLQWVADHVAALPSGDLFCWVTGWTDDSGGERLAQALQGSAARALLHFPPAPEGAAAPLLLSNPPWARPFEVFSRALGMPAGSDADPTPLLAVVVPLMFGYMFGDVGQGLVIAAAGWWWRKRFPIARLLMVGGLSAAFFGWVFGSVFGLHGLLPALWLHPLDQPLPVLLAPLLGGAVLLTLGLLLDALAAVWRGQWQRWLLTDAALVVVYIASLAALLQPGAWFVAGAAAVYFCLGHAWLAQRAGGFFGAFFKAIGELVEKTLQILINTLSFARVGAFALAHAGLSSALVALTDAADSGLAKALVLVLGNVLVIVLEAMVVAIQTTRLVLFEFFARFMQGKGRAFNPLPAPPFGTPPPTRA